MKRAVSVSLGSSERDSVAEIRLGGDCTVQLERIGVNGDLEAAAQKFRELDGAVDCLAVGGTNLGVYIDNVYYTYRSIQPMIRYVQSTPVVDGSGWKHIMEGNMANFLEDKLGNYIRENGGRKVLVVCAVERWELAVSFVRAKYNAVVFGDLMFALGIPIPIRSVWIGTKLGQILVPFTTRFFPFSDQKKRAPAFLEHYRDATVIAGDCHYILHHMPTAESGIMRGKIVVTNTTTEHDVREFRQAGVKYLVTSTPPCNDGKRSFGTNLMEAAVVAAVGRCLSWAELDLKLKEFGLEPHIQELN